jgi:hypothetical protein
MQKGSQTSQTSQTSATCGVPSVPATSPPTITSTSQVPQNIRTANIVSESQARQPVQEYTQFIEKPPVQQPTQFQTEYIHQHVQEAPIRVKEQPVQVVEQNTVIKQQPVVHRHQEVQVQKEAPINVVKQTVTRETLPAVTEKEMVVQPVRSSDTTTSTVQRSAVEGCSSTTVQVTAPSREAKAIDSALDERAVTGNVSGQQGLLDKVKETLGGAKHATHDAIETAREKAREIFNPSSSTGSTTQHTGTSTSHPQ